MTKPLHFMKPDNTQILIDRERLLKDVQAEFSTYYPFLKLEFLATDKSGKTLKSMKIDPQTSLRHLAQPGIPNTINVSYYRTVSELSHDFEHLLGVIVQVYRKSGNVWNVISITDGWTLESQNAAGEFISTEMAMTAKKVSD